jgi:hypothetical protein
VHGLHIEGLAFALASEAKASAWSEARALAVSFSPSDRPIQFRARQAALAITPRLFSVLVEIPSLLLF